MAKGKAWTRDDLYVAMNLYCKLPFGKLDQKNHLIQQVANRLGRTPSSLAMKLCNLASLDPIHQTRGIRGLQAASKLDRVIWDEFHSDWNQAGVASEEMFKKMMGMEDGPKPPDEKGRERKPPSITEKESSIKIRIGQDFFRQTILASYGGRCCITGNPVAELLIASHILPWSRYPEQRLNPQNGLCLSCLHDSAFDRGLIAFDENNRLIISKYLEDYLPEKTIEDNFILHRGRELRLPDKFIPDQRYLQAHRSNIFRG